MIPVLTRKHPRLEQFQVERAGSGAMILCLDSYVLIFFLTSVFEVKIPPNIHGICKNENWYRMFIHD